MSDLLRRYAELAVRLGANLERGQILEVTAFLEHAPLVREVARCAYRDGAAYVDGLLAGGEAVPLVREDVWQLR